MKNECSLESLLAASLREKNCSIKISRHATQFFQMDYTYSVQFFSTVNACSICTPISESFLQRRTEIKKQENKTEEKAICHVLQDARYTAHPLFQLKGTYYVFSYSLSYQMMDVHIKYGQSLNVEVNLRKK